MMVCRRRFLELAGAAMATSAIVSAAAPAWAQAYPTRPVRLIVATAAGATTDIIARLMAQFLSERLGQPFLIENRPGGGNTLGTEAVVRAPPDGYTLLLVNAVNAINVALFEKLNYVNADIVPVAGIIRVPLVMQVNPAVPARRSRSSSPMPRPIREDQQASAGTGSTPHVAGELFKMMTGLDCCTYRIAAGRPAMTDLISGRSRSCSSRWPGSGAHPRRPAAGLGGDHHDALGALPDLPTVGEFVPGYEASSWYGIGAPRARPPKSSITLTGRSMPASPIPS